MEYPKICERCGVEFTARHPNAKYCSKKCNRGAAASRRYHRKRADGLCPWCFRNMPSGGYSLCDDCRAKNREQNKARTREQRDRDLEWKKNWLEGKPGYYRQMHERATHKLRKEVFEHYGNHCACCGLDDWRFLTIDHVGGQGNKHRRETFNGKLVGGITFYRWLRKNNYPEGFQLLCYNCNCAQSRFMGICPHKLDQVEAHIVVCDGG